VLVGPDRKEYRVRKSLLCEKSDYFAAALRDGAFREGLENEIYLQGDDCAAIDRFVRWLYTSQLEPDPLTIDQVAKRHAETWVYIKLYLLADKICLESLKNKAMDAFRSLALAHLIQRRSNAPISSPRQILH
jgi:hypothetical protein